MPSQPIQIFLFISVRNKKYPSSVHISNDTAALVQVFYPILVYQLVHNLTSVELQHGDNGTLD